MKVFFLLAETRALNTFSRLLTTPLATSMVICKTLPFHLFFFFRMKGGAGAEEEAKNRKVDVQVLVSEEASQ